ncbi:MAG: 4Fe-4S dicluster domain-containing protein, partial [Deferribacteres bacterium]|nr:4Fe-4S dicluster domain-containing protein [Deferribacteres bacterium]
MLYKSVFTYPQFEVERNSDKCIVCGCCVQQCTYDATLFLPYKKKVVNDNFKCVGCKRCESLCPTGAIKIKRVQNEFKENAYWTSRTIRDIYKQAEQGGVI